MLKSGQEVWVSHLKIEDGDDKRARPQSSLRRCVNSACCRMSRSRQSRVMHFFRSRIDAEKLLVKFARRLR